MYGKPKPCMALCSNVEALRFFFFSFIADRSLKITIVENEVIHIFTSFHFAFQDQANSKRLGEWLYDDFLFSVIELT